MATCPASFSTVHCLPSTQDPELHCPEACLAGRHTASMGGLSWHLHQMKSLYSTQPSSTRASAGYFLHGQKSPLRVPILALRGWNPDNREKATHTKPPKYSGAWGKLDKSGLQARNFKWSHESKQQIQTLSPAPHPRLNGASFHLGCASPAMEPNNVCLAKVSSPRLWRKLPGGD